MPAALSGKTIAFRVAPEGTEQVARHRTWVAAGRRARTPVTSRDPDALPATAKIGEVFFGN